MGRPPVPYRTVPLPRSVRTVCPPMGPSTVGNTSLEGMS